jgi:glycosyltransferase involved in cell wall biosynthesis
MGRHPDPGRHGAPVSEPFRVLVACPYFEPGFRGGGPIRSVARMVDTVSPQVEVTLVTRDRDVGAAAPYPGISGRWVHRRRTRVFYLDTADPRQWFRLVRHLRDLPFDVLYVNSLWSSCFTILPIVASRFARFRVRQVVIAPRGELSPGALAIKAAKKRLFLRWWAPFLGRTTILWHASSDREATQIRAVFPRAEILVSANQVALPVEPLVPAAPAEMAAFVFIGRIAPMKNVKLILEALAHVGGPAGLDIYGPVEDPAYWAACTALLDGVRPGVTVRYLGELGPEAVRPTFARYDAFVFPTLGENFGHVVAESLASSCPVICSDRTPWSATIKSGGGAVLSELTPACLAAELDRIRRASPAERQAGKVRAGNTYRRWRRDNPEENLLDALAWR